MKQMSWAPLGALALALAAITPVHAQQKSVAVTAIVEHPALDAVRDGVQAALKEAGYEQGKNLKWQYQSAQGNTGTAAQIARKFIGDKPDVIVAIATPSAQAVIAATKGVPVVFSAVTDPVAAKLVPSTAKRAKVVVKGEVTKAYTLKGIAATAGAKAAIEAAGGKLAE